MDWQPIQTAPKDGSFVFLLCYENGEVRAMGAGVYGIREGNEDAPCWLGNRRAAFGASVLTDELEGKGEK